MVVFLHAVQRAVFRFELAIGTQLQAAQQLRRGAKQGEVPAAEMRFHVAAQQAVQCNQRRLAVQTLTIRRVADHRTVRAFWQRIGQIRHVLHLEGHQLADTGTTGVAARAFNHPCVAVRTVKVRGVLRQPFTGAGLRIVFDLFPDGLIVLRPAFEAPVAAVQPWRTVGGQHRGFNQQRTGTAHRIEQRRTWLPSGAHHDSGSQRFFDRRHPGAIAIAAQMQACATQIQGNTGRIAVQPDVDTQIRVFTVNVRTFFIATREAVHNGILNAQGTILAVADLIVDAVEMHRKGSVRGEDLCPVDHLYAGVEIKIAVDLALFHRQHDARRQTAPHQALVNKPRVALKMDTTLNHPALFRAQGFQFSF